MRTWLLLFCLCSCLCLALPACGKRPDLLEPPPGTQSPYPRTYPPQEKALSQNPQAASGIKPPSPATKP